MEVVNIVNKAVVETLDITVTLFQLLYDGVCYGFKCFMWLFSCINFIVVQANTFLFMIKLVSFECLHGRPIAW